MKHIVAFLMAWPLHIITLFSIGAVVYIAPQQAGLLVYKASLILIAACSAYWINRLIFRRDPEDATDTHGHYQLTIMIAAAMLAAGLAA